MAGMGWFCEKTASQGLEWPDASGTGRQAALVRPQGLRAEKRNAVLFRSSGSSNLWDSELTPWKLAYRFGFWSKIMFLEKDRISQGSKNGLSPQESLSMKITLENSLLVLLFVSWDTFFHLYF